MRCGNPNNPKYKNYGMRGIKVCDRWIHSFRNFLEDIGKCPDGLTLDRINVNGDYEPSNCRWANSKTQGNNKTCNAEIEYNGKVQTRQQWADEIGIGPYTLKYRLKFFDKDTAFNVSVDLRAGRKFRKPRSKNKAV